MPQNHNTIYLSPSPCGEGRGGVDAVVLRMLTTGYRDHVVSRGLTAALRQGRLTCLLGPNGCGKSTLLRTLAGAQPALEGSVEIEGRDITSYTPQELATRIGIVLTGRPDTPTLTVRETVAMGRSPYTGFWGRCTDEDWRIVDEAMAMVGVSHLDRRTLQTLSDGECQKVMIAKALAQQTPVILLDEPTAFIDYPGKIELLRLLARLAHDEGKTVFISTHDLEVALRLADDVWLLDRERGLTAATAQEMSLERICREFFGINNTD